MSPKDFALLLLLSLIWALHTIAGKLVVSGMEVPPLFYAAIRFCLVALLALPWLLPLPRPVWKAVVIGLLMGGGGFALFFVGIETSSPSSASIVLQITLPAMVLLGVFVLGERVRPRRAIGIALTFFGVLVVMWEPDGHLFSPGLLFVAGSAIAAAIGAIMMKQFVRMHMMQYHAMVGISSAPPLVLLSLTLETGQIDAAISGGWLFVAAVLFSAIVVSIGSHSIYYHLLRRYEANYIAPMMIISPVMTVILGILITGDPFDWRMAFGSAVVLAGILTVTLTDAHLSSAAGLLRRPRRP